MLYNIKSFSLNNFIAIRYYILIILLLTSRFNHYSQNKSVDSGISEILKNENTFENKSELYLTIGEEYFKNEEYPKAIEYFNKAISGYEKENKNSLKIAEIHRKIGEAFSTVNDYPRSLQSYLKCLEVYEISKNDNEIAKAISDIGELHLKFNNYSKALEYLFKANKLYTVESIKNKNSIRNNQLLLGICYGSMNKIDNSLFYFNNVLAQTDSTKETMNYAGILNNIGAIYSKRNENQKALKYYNNALSIFQKINNEKGIGITLSNIGFIYKKEGKNLDAINHYLNAINYLKRNNELSSLSDSYINLSDVYQSVKDYKMALLYSQKYIDINDTLNNTEQLNQVSNLEMQQEIRKKDQEIKILDQQKQLFEKDNKLKALWFYIVGITIILFAIIGYLIVRSLRISLKNNQLKQALLNKEKDELTDNLDYKNKELEKFAFHIIEKNELLEKLKNELKTFTSQDESDKSKFREISSTISNNLLIEKDRKEFEFQLDQIQESFFLKLNKLHPDLTKNDHRLCSLIIMGLSSKDISSILNVSPDSVKKSRYRLRKKLNLSENANISEYLSKL